MTEDKALTITKPGQDVEVMSFYNEALKLQEYAEARNITTVADLKPATDDLTIISKVKRGMEEKRKDYIQPFQEHIKETNDAFKMLMIPIETADKITRSKILAFQVEQNRIRQEQEEINRLRLEAARKEMELKGELTERVNLVEVGPEAPKRIDTDMGTLSQRDHWTFEIVDFSLIPDEYKILDSTKVGKVVRAGLRNIPGIRIWNEPILAINTK